jgi:hypothetical protein
VGSLCLAAVLSAGLIAAAVGTWWALRAAFGEPKTVTVEDMAPYGDLAGYKAHLAEGSVSDLRGARRAAFMSLLLVGGAIVFTWLAPYGHAYDCRSDALQDQLTCLWSPSS